MRPKKIRIDLPLFIYIPLVLLGFVPVFLLPRSLPLLEDLTFALLCACVLAFIFRRSMVFSWQGPKSPFAIQLFKILSLQGGLSFLLAFNYQALLSRLTPESVIPSISEANCLIPWLLLAVIALYKAQTFTVNRFRPLFGSLISPLLGGLKQNIRQDLSVSASYYAHHSVHLCVTVMISLLAFAVSLQIIDLFGLHVKQGLTVSNMVIFSFLFFLLQQKSSKRWVRTFSALNIPLSLKFFIIALLSFSFLMLLALVDKGLDVVFALVLQGSHLKADFHFLMSDNQFPFDAGFFLLLFSFAALPLFSSLFIRYLNGMHHLMALPILLVLPLSFFLLTGNSLEIWLATQLPSSFMILGLFLFLGLFAFNSDAKRWFTHTMLIENCSRETRGQNQMRALSFGTLLLTCLILILPPSFITLIIWLLVFPFWLVCIFVLLALLIKPFVRDDIRANSTIAFSEQQS